MAAVQCPNHEINLQMCPCTESCDRRGICCECLTYHRGSRQWPATACMRQAARPVQTLSLCGVAEACDSHLRNVEACLCEAEECPRLGWCCECVRNHWTEDGTGRVACMK